MFEAVYRPPKTGSVEKAERMERRTPVLPMHMSDEMRRIREVGEVGLPGKARER
jgi:hypothetical protein